MTNKETEMELILPGSKPRPPCEGCNVLADERDQYRAEAERWEGLHEGFKGEADRIMDRYRAALREFYEGTAINPDKHLLDSEWGVEVLARNDIDPSEFEETT